MNSTQLQLVISNMREIIRTNPGTYSAYIAQVTINSLEK